jgi:hypothetical protein
MDFNALQHKLFALDPSDPREDLRKLAESAGGMPQESAPITESLVQESVEVQEGTMPVEGDYSLSDFAALAGVTLTEAQKTGSAGQLKGKDAIKKQPAGTNKNPTRDKLVGEEAGWWDSIKGGYAKGKKNYNNLGAIGLGKDDIAGKIDKALGGTPSKSKAVSSTTSKTPYMDVNNYKEFLKKHTVALKQIAADPEKLKRFETWLEKWNEDIEEAPKPKPIKARDPSAQYMNDLRKSGAMGAHKDKKRDAKMGKEKHKGKEYTTESIKEMLYRKLNNKK